MKTLQLLKNWCVRSARSITFVHSSTRKVTLASGALVLASSAYAANAEYVDPADCGGDGQPACYLSAAKYLGQVKTSHPGGDAFKDPRNGGEWWTCDGWRRTAYAVTDSKACATGVWPFNERLRHARFIAPVNNPQPAGSFIDIRLDDLSAGSQYWRCPEGFTRNANGVTHPAACSATIGKACDDGNIDVGNPFGGYTCYAKNVCGGLGQRPCLIVERIPSCDSGLAEDFIDGMCIDKAVAQCLTTTRVVRLVAETVSDVTKTLNEANSFMDELFGDSPIFNAVKNTVGMDLGLSELSYDPETQLFGTQSTMDNTLQMVDEAANLLGGYFPEIGKMKANVESNHEAIIRFLGDSEKCGLSEAERMKEFLQVVGYGLPDDFQSYVAQNDTSAIKAMVQHIAPQAHAVDYGDSTFLKFGITLDASVFLGFTYEISVVVDTETGEFAWFTGIGPSLTFSSANLGGNYVDAGVAFSGGILTADSIESMEGWGGAISFSAQGTSSTYGNLVGGFELLFDDLKDGLVIEGVAFTIGGASKKDVPAIGASFSYSHDWKISKNKEYVEVPRAAKSINVAKGKIASMSSVHTSNLYLASSAVDGNTESGFAHNSNYVAGEWWQVDLGQVHNLTSSEWFNRNDCCQARMNNYTIKGSLNGTDWFEINTQNTTMGFPTTIAMNTSARYIRLYQNKAEPLNFSEAKIYGTPATNLALNKTASMKSAAYYNRADAQAANAVDGDLSWGMAHNSIFDAGEWWKVDLGRVYVLHGSNWFNRLDCCQARMNNYTVQGSIDGVTWFDISAQSQQMGHPTEIHMKNKEARYVRLLQNKAEPINFREVQIYGVAK